MMRKRARRAVTGLVVLAAVGSALVVPGSAVAAPSGPVAADSGMVLGEQASTTTSVRVRPDGVCRFLDTWYMYLQNKDGRWEEFWRCANNAHLMHAWQLSPGGVWSADYSLGCCLYEDEFDGRANNDGRLEIFVRGYHDWAIWHKWQTTPGGGWSGWDSLGGYLITRPYARSSADGTRIVIEAIGGDGYWWVNQQTRPNCCWSGWFRG